MVQLGWLFLIGAIFFAPFAESQYRPVKKREKTEADKDVERKAVLKALGSIIMERRRKGKGLEFDPEGQTPEDYDEFRHARFNRFHEGKESRQVDADSEIVDYEDYSVDVGGEREGKQVNSNLEECETQGFETRTREECNEVSEIECNPIQVTKYKTEIVQRCKTLTDKKCEVLYTEVPKEKCEPSEEQKCYTEYKLVEEQIYKDECHTEVQNICEKEIAVPVEVPYPVHVPVNPPPYGHLHPTLSPLVHPPPTVTLAPHQDDHFNYPAQNKPLYQTTFAPQPTQSPSRSSPYAYNPTPHPIRDFGYKVTRKRRDVVTDNKASRNDQFEALLDKALDNLFQTHNFTSNRNKKEIHGHGQKGVLTKLSEFKHIPASHHHQGKHGHAAGQKHLEDTLSDLLFHLNHPDGNQSPLPQPFLSLLKLEPRSEEPTTKLLHSGPVEVPLNAGHNSSDSGEHLDGGGAPVITTEELPAPPGCRSIATTTCHKVPYKKSTKVPYETCELVPSVKCGLVLKEVAELDCKPVITEECNDFAKEIPFLVSEEECEEVFFDECLEVMLSNFSTEHETLQIEEQVPVLVCTRTRLDNTAVFLQRGQTFRKEGEKRRRKTGAPTLGTLFFLIAKAISNLIFHLHLVFCSSPITYFCHRKEARQR